MALVHGHRRCLLGADAVAGVVPVTVWESSLVYCWVFAIGYFAGRWLR